MVRWRVKIWTIGIFSDRAIGLWERLVDFSVQWLVLFGNMIMSCTWMDGKSSSSKWISEECSDIFNAGRKTEWYRSKRLNFLFSFGTRTMPQKHKILECVCRALSSGWLCWSSCWVQKLVAEKKMSEREGNNDESIFSPFFLFSPSLSFVLSFFSFFLVSQLSYKLGVECRNRKWKKKKKKSTTRGKRAWRKKWIEKRTLVEKETEAK